MIIVHDNDDDGERWLGEGLIQPYLKKNMSVILFVIFFIKIKMFNTFPTQKLSFRSCQKCELVMSVVTLDRNLWL